VISGAPGIIERKRNPLLDHKVRDHVLNNKGYGTERPMLDGPFNDVLSWNYYRIPEVIGHGRGFMIETEEQLEESLSVAENIYSKELCILDVHLDINDASPALQRLTEMLGKKVH
jgi:indolepyruvate decarboxylase